VNCGGGVTKVNRCLLGCRLTCVWLGLPEVGDWFCTAPGRIIKYIAVNDWRGRQLECLCNRPRGAGIDTLCKALTGARQGKQATGKKNSQKIRSRRFRHGVLSSLLSQPKISVVEPKWPASLMRIRPESIRTVLGTEANNVDFCPNGSAGETIEVNQLSVISLSE
jgi:hypothetical protein